MVVFARDGRRGASIGQIETAAGMPRGNGAFHRHFPSKEALFDELVERELSLLGEREAAAREVRDPRVVVALHIDQVLRDLAVVGGLVTILTREGPDVADGDARARLVARVFDHSVLEEPVIAAALRVSPADAGLVIESCATGHQLATQFFGVSLGGLGRVDVVQGLTDLLLGEPAVRAS